MFKCTNSRAVLLWAAVLILFAAMLIPLGCDNSTGGYKTFTLERGIAHFSFEYPAGYDKLKVEVRNDVEHQYTDVAFAGPLLIEEIARSTMSIFVTESDNGIPDPEAALERSLYHADNLPDFKLLDRSSLEVAGVKGEQTVFFYNRPLPDIAGWYPPPVPSIMRKVYFVYGKSTWSMSIRSHESMADADEIVFEHLLQTFKILN